MTLKNQIVRLHRWFGVLMCLFFAAWFLSGFVMLYVDFPQYSKKNRLAHQARLPLSACNYLSSQLSGMLSQDTSWKRIRMDMLLNRPVVRMEDNEGGLYAYYADNGRPVQKLSASQACAVAMNYLSGSYSPVLMERISELDQWTPRSAFLIHMPIYRITMNDPAETVIYVSSKTGEIVQVHTLSQRFLAWCGPIIHWIYPKALILRRPVWRVVVILFSSLGIFASLAGIIVGFIRVKKKKKYVSPYRQRWFRWHHYTGFFFGLFVFTWVFSGLLTMSPFGWSPELDMTAQENLQLQRGNLMIKSFTQNPGQAFAQLKDTFSQGISLNEGFPQIGFSQKGFSQKGFSQEKILQIGGLQKEGSRERFMPVEIELKRFLGRSYYLASNAEGQTQIAVADRAGMKPFTYFPHSMMLNAIQSVHRTVYKTDDPLKITLIHQEDNYYYSKHNDNALPVLRIQYADAENTCYYADPATGAILLKNNTSARTSRWLYHGLHSLDFFNLQHQRPVWDVLMILMLTGGTAVSLTGLILGFRYLRKKGKVQKER